MNTASAADISVITGDCTGKQIGTKSAFLQSLTFAVFFGFPDSIRELVVELLTQNYEFN